MWKNETNDCQKLNYEKKKKPVNSMGSQKRKEPISSGFARLRFAELFNFHLAVHLRGKENGG